MGIANSTHGELRFRGVKIAKVRNVSVETQRQALEITGIGDMDDEFAYGKRTTSGSCTLLYKIDDQATKDLMNRILEDAEQPDELVMVLYRGTTDGTISGPVLINSQGVANSVGDNVTVNVSFMISGKPAGRY
jgi:hypothetical protein